MNRFEYREARLVDDEVFVRKEKGIKLYDGDEKTGYVDGDLVITTHRLFWGRTGDISAGRTCLVLQLKHVAGINEEWASANIFGKKRRLILRLSPFSDGTRKKLPGPSDNSTYNFIKLSAKDGIDDGLMNSIRETVAAKVWDVVENEDGQVQQRIKLRTGIMGIERSLQERRQQTDDSISIAFQDLTKLMAMAQDMTLISKAIATKIKDSKGDISDDETIKFKAYLMSLGIDDPVMRDQFSSTSAYHDSLARQLTEFLLEPIIQGGGMMALTDVYCRVNRARGMELVSPEDVLQACQRMKGPLQLRTFPSGAMVLQTETHNNDKITDELCSELEKCTSISSEELARISNISLMLSTERLLAAERSGKVCRDESVEGLRFYLNLFLRDSCEFRSA